MLPWACGPFRALVALAAMGTLSAAEPLRVFLFAGQSNMEGADTRIEEVDLHPPFRGAVEPMEDVRYSYQLGANHRSDGWTALQVAGNMFGPEMTFARRLKKETKGPLAIIKDAWGGTTLVNDWAPDGGDEKSRKLYDRFVTHVRERLGELDEKGQEYRVEALMWHQGENDMFHAEGKQAYAENLARFIARLRQDLKLPELKVFVGEISTKGVWGMDNRANVALIRTAQDEVVEDDPRVFFVPTSHLGFKVGRPFGLHYHFGTLGQLQHGEAYAEHYLASVGRLRGDEDQRIPPSKMPKADRVRLFVFGGQRVMEGEGAYVDELDGPEGSLKQPQRALFQYSLGNVRSSTGWEALGPVGYLGNFGPELSFGRAMIPQMKDDEVLAIYKFTDSGSQSLDWLPEGSDHPYRDRYAKWIEGIRKIRSDLEAQGYECDLEAVFWHCGENDRALTWMADKYAERFKRFMESTRRDLGVADLEWFLTEQPMIPESLSGDAKLYDLNPDLEALASDDANLFFIETSDLPHQPVRFGTEGTVRLGERMAEAWEKSGR